MALIITIVSWSSFRLLKWICLFLICLAFVSCRQTEPTRDIGQRYFPLSSTASWTYQVDSIAWDAFSNSSDTLTYFIRWKSLQLDTISDNELSVLLLREDSNSKSKKWQEIKRFKMQRDLYRADIEQEGRRKVVLVFPVSLNKRWDAAMYLADGPTYLRYTALDEAWQQGALAFNECIRVTEKSDSNFFQNEQIHNVYAPEIGLIHKFATETEIQNNRKSGYLFQMNLIKYTP